MKLFGHEFRPMARSDWDGFAGADQDTVICYLEDSTVLLWSEGSGILTVVDIHGNEEQFVRSRYGREVA